MDLDEVIMFIRAVCSSRKGPTSIQELKNDFYELNGSYIPYKNFGFDSLLEFLESEPDKFRLVNDKFTGEISLHPVIDAELSGLRQLVSGQKSSKKKKKSKKSTYRPGAPRFKQFQTHRYPAFNRDYTSPSVRTRQEDFIRPVLSTTERVKLDIAVSKTVRFNIEESLKQERPKPNKIDPTVIENLFISNAAYFLNEHQVYVCYVLDCERVYIRLVSENFSEKFDKMFKSMNDFYFGTGKKRLDDFEVNNICVALHEMKFHRVQIKKIFDQKQLECFHLDEGKTKIYSKNDLYEIENDFLQVKFQAVTARINRFDELTQNLYLQELIIREIGNKKLLARKTQSNPLTLNLFNAENISINETIIKNNANFLKYKPEQNSIIETPITHIDSESKLLYLEKPSNQLFNKLATQFTQFFHDQNNKKILGLLNHAAKNQIKNEDFVKNNIFSAKYNLDLNWYRAKFIRENPQTNQALVLFVDFGNKELVDLNELYIIPESFNLFKNIPYQSFPCTLVTEIHDTEYFTNLYYENTKCTFKVVHYNPTGIPSLEFLEAKTACQEDLIEFSFSSSKTIDSKLASENDLIEKINKLDLNNNNFHQIEESSSVVRDDDIVIKEPEEFPEDKLKIGAQVHIKYVNTPFDFIINVDDLMNDYETLKMNMKHFYLNKPEMYKVKSFVKNRIYVCQNQNLDCVRVRFDAKFSNYAIVYDIDGGNFDAVKLENLFGITRKFADLKPLAIKCRLSNINYDHGDKWSSDAKDYFLKIADKKKTYKVMFIKKSSDTKSVVYEVELGENKSISLNNLMVKSGVAK